MNNQLTSDMWLVIIINVIYNWSDKVNNPNEKFNC